MQILDGKNIASVIRQELAAETALLRRKGKIPHLAAILVGNDGASETYVAAKVKACEATGFRSSLFRYPDTVSENELLDKIAEINNDPDVDGILVQLPLPSHISVQLVTERISPEKDVDGFHPVNIGRMNKNLPCYISATPLGILMMLKHAGIETAGKHCVVLGRSQIVGSPMSILMSRNTSPGNCTVTLCHSKTKDIASYTRQADIVIIAMGKPGYITADMIKTGAVVIDVGTTRVEDKTANSGYRVKGDVRFEEVAPKCSYITPVPGGVGPMTITGLLYNTLLSAKKEIYP